MLTDWDEKSHTHTHTLSKEWKEEKIKQIKSNQTRLKETDACLKQCYNFSQEIQFKFTLAHSSSSSIKHTMKKETELERERSALFCLALLCQSFYCCLCCLCCCWLFAPLSFHRIKCHAFGMCCCCCCCCWCECLCCNNTLIAPYYHCECINGCEFARVHSFISSWRFFLSSFGLCAFAYWKFIGRNTCSNLSALYVFFPLPLSCGRCRVAVNPIQCIYINVSIGHL